MRLRSSSWNTTILPSFVNCTSSSMPNPASAARSKAARVFSAAPRPCSPRWAKGVPRQPSARFRDGEGAIRNRISSSMQQRISRIRDMFFHLRLDKNQSAASKCSSTLFAASGRLSPWRTNSIVKNAAPVIAAA